MILEKSSGTGFWKMGNPDRVVLLSSEKSKFICILDAFFWIKNFDLNAHDDLKCNT